MARWSEGFTELVQDTAERVVGCARQILEGVEVSPESGEPITSVQSRSPEAQTGAQSSN